MRKLLVAMAIAGSALLVSVAPAFAINDARVPGDNCAAAGAEAVGHPAFSREQAEGVSAPFSLNNPGASTGAKGSENSQAPCDAPE